MPTKKSQIEHIKFGPVGVDQRGRRYAAIRIEIGSSKKMKIVSLSDLQKSRMEVLDGLGACLLTPASQAEFMQKAQEVILQKKPSFKVIDKPGWHHSAFVLPNEETIGRSTDLSVCLPVRFQKYSEKFVRKGTLERWQALARMAQGNSRFMLALALAFTGPVATLMGWDAPMIQIVGPPGGGKTGMVTAAGSVWGSGGSRQGHFFESWKQTDANLGLLALAHHGTLLILDELRTFKFSKYGWDYFCEVVMSIGNGAMTGRFTEAEAAFRWRTPVLSTSNHTLDDLAIKYRGGIDDAVRFRLIDVPVISGTSSAFEKLHGFRDHGSFTEQLRRIADDHCGVAAYAFVNVLAKRYARDKSGLERSLGLSHSRYIDWAKRAYVSKDRDLTRFHDRMATIYTSAKLAMDFKILPWTPSELLAALRSCAEGHLVSVANRASCKTMRQDREKPIKLFKSYLSDRSAEFLNTEDRNNRSWSIDEHNNCPGYINCNHRGIIEYLFADRKLQEICGGKSGSEEVKDWLQENDILFGDKKRPSTRRQFFGDRWQVIAIDAHKLKNLVASEL